MKIDKGIKIRIVIIIVLLITIFVLLFVKGCEKEKINEDREEEKIVETCTLNVGKYILSCGKYVGDSYENGTSNNSVYSVYEIKSEGRYTYLSESGKETSGTYKVTESDLSIVGKMFNGVYGIAFDDGGYLAVPSDNTLQVLAGAMEKYHYVSDN